MDYETHELEVKFFDLDKGFGFFCKQGYPDVFISASVLAASGFESCHMRAGAGATVKVGPGRQEGTWKAVEITKIGDLTQFSETTVDRKGNIKVVKLVDRRDGTAHYVVRTVEDNADLSDEMMTLKEARDLIGKTADGKIAA